MKQIIFFVVMVFLVFGNCFAEGRSLKINFIDVGEGDSIFIEAPNNETALIDTGNLVTGFKVAEYLKNNDIKSLDHLILTHPHLDHIGGIFFILQMMEVENIYDNGENLSGLSKDSDAYRWYGDLIKKSNKYSALRAGDSLSLGEVKLKVLWPLEQLIFSNFNANSVVIMVKYKDFQCLLTGDLSSLAEMELLKKERHLSVDILKLGHHGFSDASSEEFLKAASPKIAIISVNKDNIRGYPSEEVIERLEKIGTNVYRTDKNGNVSIYIEGDGKITVKAEK